jgi:hypothetical protein
VPLYANDHPYFMVGVYRIKEQLEDVAVSFRVRTIAWVGTDAD